MQRSGVQYDSRRVRPGDVFVAMRGGTTDGNRFVKQAMEQGAVAIVTDSAETFAALQRDKPGVDARLVENGRRALAEIASEIYGAPEKQLKISAITGTNGKTTTAYLLEQLLTSVGRKCVLIGTIETRIAGVAQPSEHTTPEASDLLKIFADGVAAGCTEVVMEMSSHALAQERVWGLPVDVAIFTNLTQDHLDFHGTMEAYAAAKEKLFAGVGAGPPSIAVINNDAEYAGQMMDAYAGENSVVRYGIGASPGATHKAEALGLTLGDMRFRFVTPEGTVAIHSPLSGRVNVENLLAAMCAALARGLTLEQIASAATKLKQVPGRFEIVAGSKQAGFTVVVDYAHTDDALRNLIALAREQVAPHGGCVITMFGCGGDRDRSKRPRMGRAAGEASDLAVVTSDNPRSENPMAIIDEILLGLRETPAKFVVEPDRAAAIEIAIRAAKPGDIVLLAGKGHEKTQTFADGAVHFDDAEQAEIVLNMLQAEGNK